jgi:hypothetical protein
MGNIVLFVHFVGMLLLFVSLGVEWMAGRALRQSAGHGAAIAWTTIARRALRLQSVAALLIVISGGAMAMRFGVSDFAWVRGSLLAVVLIAALAGLMRRRLGRSTGEELARFWTASVLVRATVALGAVYLMTAKSELLESVVILVVAGTAGAAAGIRASANNRGLSVNTE